MLETILKQRPVDGRSLFVDMNSFFASVEQEVNPRLRDQPVGVCPFLSDATCVIAASIEAKRQGVATAMPVTQAKQLCPEIKLVEARPRLYRDYHRRIMGELENLPCRVIIKSIDEALLLVPSYKQSKAKDLALYLKQHINGIGNRLKCSIGIGSNLFLAKIASGLVKPDGLVEVKLAGLENFYSKFQLTDLYGISWRMAKRLRAIGITNPLDFYQASFALLKKSFGVNGEAWYLRLRGFEIDLKPTHRRMIGHEMTIVPQPARTRAEVISVASQLTYRAAIRLRQAHLAARGIVIYLRFNDRTWWKKVYHGRQAFFDSDAFFHQVCRLLNLCRLEKPVRLVSVSAIDLVPMIAMTRQLFQDRRREEWLSQALDEINFRYGENTIVTARQLLADKPRDAIGYGNAALNAQELPK